MRNHTWYPARFTEKNMMQLLELRRLQYGDTEFVQTEYIRWQLAENPAGRAISWLALASEDNVLGEYWIAPVKFKINKATYLGSVGANALVHPAHRGRKIFTVLGKRCSEDCVERLIKFTLYIPNQVSLRGLVRKLKCKDLGAIKFLIYPIDIHKLAEYRFQGKLSQRLALHALRIFFLLAMRKERQKIDNLSIGLTSISSFDRDFDALWNRIKDKYPCIAVRDSVFMNWRYARIPMRKYSILLAKGGNRIVGYLISRSATVLGIKSSFIVDFLFESSTLGWAAGHSLVDATIEKFKKEESHLVCCLSLPHTEEYRLLKSHGFFTCPEIFKPHPFHLVAQVHDKTVERKYLDNLKHWYWSLGDYDVV